MLKSFTSDKGVKEASYGKAVALGSSDYLFSELLVAEAVGATKCVFNKILGEASREVRFTSGDDIAQRKEVRK